MSDFEHPILSAYMVRQGLACPLRYDYLRGEESMTEPERWKRDVKRVLERVLCLQVSGEVRKERSFREQLDKTHKWLRDPGESPLYGGRLMLSHFSARYPLLRRHKERIRLYQVHGRLMKGPVPKAGDKRTWREGRWVFYLREAAFKVWVLKHLYPDLLLDVTLCFPSRRFRSPVPNLFERVARGSADKEDVDSLLVEADATEPVMDLLDNANLYGSIHPVLQGLSFDRQMDLLRTFMTGQKERPFMVTQACQGCRFRHRGQDGRGEGCWETHLEGESGSHEHTFELIGSGNGRELNNGYILQKQIPLLEVAGCFEELGSHRQKSISMADRRTLQLLSAHGKRVPVEWIRKELFRQLSRLSPPYHFIDFEAASAALPLIEGDRPYGTFLFQFSCHTLEADGSVRHTEWLAPSKGALNRSDFVRAFLSIPDIRDGVLIHYSPFEKQALEKLAGDLVRSDDSEDNGLAVELRSVIRKKRKQDRRQMIRFMDMGRLVHDYYYHCEMKSGLGLKELLAGLLHSSEWMRSELETLPGSHLSGSEAKNASTGLKAGRKTDPLSPHALVTDGPGAMYAWLYSRLQDCDDSTRTEIRKELIRYCSMDTASLLLAFRYWRSVDGNMEDGDRILWEQHSF